MPKYLLSMKAKHTGTFRSRLRARAFGWKGSLLACQRLKETVMHSEISEANGWKAPAFIKQR